MLWVLRSLVVVVAVISTSISITTNKTMYELVESGYSVTLVVAFVPLVCGIYWKRASTQAAIFSIVLAVTVWLGVKSLQESTVAALETAAAEAAATQVEPAKPGATPKAEEPAAAETQQPANAETELEVELPLWTVVPPQLYGLVASFIGMFIGGLLPQWITHKHPSPEHLAKRRGPATGH
jgi:SSS family solute:Na+ symporter